MKQIKKLFDNEKYIFQAGIINELVVYGILILESDRIYTNFNESLVRKALDYMQKRHPLLRAHAEYDFEKSSDIHLIINDENDSKTKEIDFEWINLKQSNRENMIREIENFKNKKMLFKNRLLWSFGLIEYNDSAKNYYSIVLKVNQSVSDGMNVSALVVEIGNIMNALINQTECDEMKIRLELEDSIYAHVEKSQLFTKEILFTRKF